MAEPLVFAPDYLLPVHMQGAVGYREGHEPDAELLERVGGGETQTGVQECYLRTAGSLTKRF